MRRRGAATALISIFLAALATTPARAASLDGPPQIAGLEFGQSTVSVSGLNVAKVTVAVHLKDMDGVDDVGDPGFFPTPNVSVGPVGAPGAGEAVFLSLASGTIYDGWWQGDAYVPSRFSGEVRISWIEAFDKQYQELNADPASYGFDPRLTVVGTNVPHVTAGFSPSPVLYGNNVSFKGRMIHKETGQGWSGVTLKILGVYGDCCSVVKTITTDAQGYWRVTFSTTQLPEWVSAAVTYSASDSIQRGFFVVNSYFRQARVWWRVWAFPASSRIRLGTSTIVTGSVAPATVPTDAYLQRLVSGVWKTVATTHAHSSGRFYLTARPPSRGYHRYRVLIPASGSGFVATATKIFTIYVY
jgi:hypothetical protein